MESLLEGSPALADMYTMIPMMLLRPGIGERGGDIKNYNTVKAYTQVDPHAKQSTSSPLVCVFAEKTV